MVSDLGTVGLTAPGDAFSLVGGWVGALTAPDVQPSTSNAPMTIRMTIAGFIAVNPFNTFRVKVPDLVW
jgi:hypothetical protein